MSKRLIDAVAFEKDIKTEASDSIANAVIRILDRQPTIEENKWISVNDELPDVGVKVLTLSKFDHVRDRTLYNFRDGELVFRPDGLKPGKDITHWQPLPKPPKECGGK